MAYLSDRQAAEYLHRCFTAVDGLWFLALEERLGFDAALDADVAVWSVLPKIQARRLREMLDATADMTGLADCIEAKLSLDRFTFTIENNPDGSLTAIITACPWHETMQKSGRGHLSGQIGDRICRVEHAVFASQFGNIACDLTQRICDGAASCHFTYTETPPPTPEKSS